VLDDKKEKLGLEQLQNIERMILLRSVDSAWMEHIDNMEQLKQGIGLRAYGQNDPVKEYTKEGFDLFDDMIMRIQEDTVKYLFNLSIQVVPAEEAAPKVVDFSQMKTNENEIEGKSSGPATSQNKVGRNDPCPCGSGKKYKKCCGA
jgi:preprotein translocase subunit SecA